MTRKTNAPALPTQAEIDAAVARGKMLRSRAFLDAIASLFQTGETRPTQHAYGNGAR